RIRDARGTALSGWPVRGVLEHADEDRRPARGSRRLDATLMHRDSNQIQLNNEQELLVAAALPKLSADGIERLRRAGALPLDWNLVFDLAAWHGLTPMLARNLARHSPDQLPDDVAGEFAARLTANVQRTLL